VRPQRLCIALALDQNDVTGRKRAPKTPESVGNDLRALLPPEPVVALGVLVEPQPIAHGSSWPSVSRYGISSEVTPRKYGTSRKPSLARNSSGSCLAAAYCARVRPEPGECCGVARLQGGGCLHSWSGRRRVTSVELQAVLLTADSCRVRPATQSKTQWAGDGSGSSYMPDSGRLRANSSPACNWPMRVQTSATRPGMLR